jgi:negative regulator of flagellin synthesis FlgM
MEIPGSPGSFKGSISKTGSKETKKADSKKSASLGSEKSSSQGAGTEKVLLSSKARDIAKINEIIKSSPEIRTEKVERIKNEIAKGTYSVDGKEIAEKILTEILAESSFLK